MNIEEIRAHPRVCGENGGGSQQLADLAGSSPRVRGKPPPTMPSDRSVGLIPACAGKTLNNADQVANVRAHPRVCGENLSAECGLSGSEGSSPRVRGKLRWAIGVGWADRAHPRVCGENLRPLGPKETFHGSSPRVRGKPGMYTKNPVEGRLIPACAGKTRLRGTRPGCSPAHPRVCGENSSEREPKGSSRGSSPRVRGKRLTLYAQQGATRLIPACAGKTSPSDWSTHL